MTKFKLIIKSTIYGLLSLFILLVCALAFLLATTPGIYTTIKLANLFLPGKISIKKPHGRLIDTLSLGQLNYLDMDHELKLKDVSIRWRLADLLKGKLDIKTFSAKQLQIIMDDKKEETSQIINNINLQATLSTQTINISSFEANYQGIQIQLTGSASPQYPYQLNSTLSFVTPKNNPVQLNGKITANGDISLYQWQGELKQPNSVSLFGSLKNADELQTVLKWQSLQWPLDAAPKFKTGRGRLALNGSLDNLVLDFNGKIETPIDSNLRIHAQKRNNQLTANTVLNIDKGYLQGQVEINPQAIPIIKGTISSNSLNLNSYSEDLGAVDISSDFSGDSISNLTLHANANIAYLNSRLKASISYLNQKLKAQADLGENYAEINATGPFQWQAYAKISQPELLSASLAGLKTTLALNASVENPQKGTFNLTLNQGQYQLPSDSLLEALYFSGGHIKGELSKKGFDAAGQIAIDSQKSLKLALKLPNFNLNDGLTDKQKIDSEVNLNINSLSFLKNLSKNIDQADGWLAINLTTTGTVKKPELTGKIQLKNGLLSLPQAGLKLQPIQAELTSKGNAWQLQGMISSNNQPLTMSGKGELSPAPSGTIKLSGNNVQIIHSSEYTINASPDVNFKFSPKNFAINGTVTIPEATISPQTFSSSSNLSDDVVFVGEEQKQTATNISADVNLIMGKEVKLDIQGLKGNLDGAIRIKQEPQSTLNASGNLSISKGFYKAYGQELIIEQGQLIFTGGLISNPGINLRAIRRFSNTNRLFSGSDQLFDFNNANLQTVNFSENTTVGIQVSGRINSPKIKLFSNPSNLSQADILSMLLLGRPASQANQAGGQVLMSAVSAMNLDNGTGGTQLLGQLKEKLGFDINMQSNSNYNQQTKTVSDSTAFVIGKSLSKRIYISYNIGLLQTDSNVLTLKYLLNKFFSIQVSASDTGNGIDFLYTRHKP